MARVIVCGGRDFYDKALLFDSLDRILRGMDSVEIVSGHARGADAIGEEYAGARSLRLKIIKAEWKRYGHAAGPVRNGQMLRYAMGDAPMVVAFWDGKSRGTKDMMRRAQDAGVKVQVVGYGLLEDRTWTEKR